MCYRCTRPATTMIELIEVTELFDIRRRETTKNWRIKTASKYQIKSPIESQILQEKDLNYTVKSQIPIFP